MSQPDHLLIDDEEPEIVLEPTEPEAPDEPEIPVEPAPAASVELVGLMEILPADFPLPILTRFVADVRLRATAEQAAAYALSLEVHDAEGITRADLALAALRGSQKAIAEHFDEPATVAHQLHKRITSTRSEWLEPGERAVKQVGLRMATEQRRLDALAAAERRKAQEVANAEARARAEAEAAKAEQAQAPAPVVEALKREAGTATAAPVPVTQAAPAMRSSSIVSTWKARIAGTPADEEPNPKMAQLTPGQLEQVKAAMRAIVDGNGAVPITAFEINWSAINARAKSDKGTLQMPGFEAFEDIGVRAKAARAR